MTEKEEMKQRIILTSAGYIAEEDDDIQVYQRPWVGLTDDELLHIGIATGLERAAVEMISNKLKEKNT